VVAGAAVAAIVGLLQFVTGSSFVDQISIPGLTQNSVVSGVFDRNGFSRAAGTSTHPIEFGVLLTMVLPVALHLALNDTRRGTVRRWFPVAAIGAAVPVTMSRSALLGLALVLLVLLPTWPKRRRRWTYASLALGFGGVYVAVPGMLGTMTRLFTGIAADNSAQSRVDSYSIALHYIALDPLFGRGFGTFQPRYHILDNQYLGMVVEIGLVGAATFIGLLASGAVVAARMARRLPMPADRSLAVSLAAGLASAAAAAATFDALGFPQVAGSVFLYLGLIAALSRLTSPGTEARAAEAVSVDRLAAGDPVRQA
jgi:O-antigen ligase